MDDQVALPVARMRSEPMPERIRSGASGRRVSVPDEELDERSTREWSCRECSDRERREDAEYCRRRSDTPACCFGGVIEDGAAAEGLSDRHDGNARRADVSKGCGDTVAECGQGGVRRLIRVGPVARVDDEVALPA